MSGFGDEPAGVTGARVLEAHRGIDPLMLDAVQLLRNIHRRGGSATIQQLSHSRTDRAHKRRCLMLAAREGLVIAGGRDRYALTQKSRDAIASSEAVEPEEAA